MDIFLKAFYYLFVGVAATAILYLIVRGLIDKKISIQILKNPCYVDAKINEIMPGTPTSYGLFNITVDYSFTAINGEVYTKKNVLTGIKTMDLPKLNVGFTIPVVYLRNDPSKNMLNMRNAIDDYTRCNGRKNS